MTPQGRTFSLAVCHLNHSATMPLISLRSQSLSPKKKIQREQLRSLKSEELNGEKVTQIKPYSRKGAKTVRRKRQDEKFILQGVRAAAKFFKFAKIPTPELSWCTKIISRSFKYFTSFNPSIISPLYHFIPPISSRH